MYKIISYLFIICILIIYLYRTKANLKNKNYLICNNFLDQKTINQYLNYSSKHKEIPSKFGNIVQENIKIRKDVFFTTQESKILDRIIFEKLPELEKQFGIKIKYRENYKLGNYYGNNKGFYSPHTDIQGSWKHRKISMVLCLSDKKDYQGGIFKLVDLNKKFKFNKGDIIFFKSDLLHGVEPVTNGIRQVIISFMWDEEGEKLRKIHHNLDYNYKFNL